MSRKNRILNRYELTEDKNIIIDISVRAIEVIIQIVDRTATYPKRDLDLDFVEHLVNCVQEIGKYAFIIRISSRQPEVPEKMERVRMSIRTFFEYLNERELKQLQSLVKQSCILLGLGIGLILISITIEEHLANSESVMLKILTEGVTVISWVSLWQAISNIILIWQSYYQTMQINRRIINALVIFRQSSNS